MRIREFFFIFVSVIFCFGAGEPEGCGSGSVHEFIRSPMRSRYVERKYKTVAEPHATCGSSRALFTLNLEFFMLRLLGLRKFSLRVPVLINFFPMQLLLYFNCNIYFCFQTATLILSPCLAVYSSYFIMHRLFCIYCNIYYICHVVARRTIYSFNF
jgi:hypothetical protein